MYISKEELSEEIFFQAVGVDRDGPVGDLFVEMYSELNDTLRNHGKYVTTKESADSLSGTHEFTPEVIEKMKEAIDQGKIVVTSSLDSDGSLAESLLCVTMFEIDSDAFYINAFNNYW